MITIDGTGLVTGGTLRSPGNVINVAQEFKTDTAYVDNTGPAIGTDLIALNYAATSSSSKLLILANMYVSNQNQDLHRVLVILCHHRDVFLARDQHDLFVI